eukprot:g2655.t1
MNSIQIGSVYDIFKLPSGSPTDRARMKILYPSKGKLIETYQNKPIDGVPFPIVIFASGAGVEAFRYQWLGERLVREIGVAFVLYDTTAVISGVMKPFPAVQDMTDISKTVSPLGGIIQSLSNLNKEGILAERLDLHNIVLGGHSMGGKLVLEYGNDTQIESIKGIFTYGIHLAIPMAPGVAPGSIRRVSGSAPVMLMGGTLDTLVGGSGPTFGVEWDSILAPVHRTFDKAFESGRRVYFLELNGANHMFIVDPVDITWTYVCYDTKMHGPVELFKDVFSRIVSLFIKQCVCQDDNVRNELEDFCRNQTSIVSKFEVKD